MSTEDPHQQENASPDVASQYWISQPPEFLHRNLSPDEETEAERHEEIFTMICILEQKNLGFEQAVWVYNELFTYYSLLAVTSQTPVMGLADDQGLGNMRANCQVYRSFLAYVLPHNKSKGSVLLGAGLCLDFVHFEHLSIILVNKTEKVILEKIM